MKSTVNNANHAPMDNSLTQFEHKNKTALISVNIAAKENNLSTTKQNAKSARLANTKHPTMQPVLCVPIAQQENTLAMMARMMKITMK